MKKIISILIVSLLFFACKSNKDNVKQDDVLGFWEGKFTPNKTKKMVFYFWEEKATLRGNSFIVGRDSINYEDPLIKIAVESNNLVFDIPTQSLHFEGTISKDPLSVEGKSYAPGGMPLQLSFHKVQEENVWHAAEIKQRCKSLK